MVAAAKHEDVVAAIREDRLRVGVGGTVEARGPWPKSKWRSVNHELVRGPHQKKPYVRVRFACSRGQFRCLLHRLVWFGHRGAISNGLEMDHIDDDKRNNALSNLDLVTHSENLRRGFASGAIPKPYKNRGISMESANEIRRRVEAGERQCDVADEYGVSRNVVCRIVKRHTYVG